MQLMFVYKFIKLENVCHFIQPPKTLEMNQVLCFKHHYSRMLNFKTHLTLLEKGFDTIALTYSSLQV